MMGRYSAYIPCESPPAFLLSLSIQYCPGCSLAITVNSLRFMMSEMESDCLSILFDSLFSESFSASEMLWS